MRYDTTKRRAEEYEYEPHGIFGTGHSSPLGPAARTKKPLPLGLQHAAKRARAKPAAKKGRKR